MPELYDNSDDFARHAPVSKQIFNGKKPCVDYFMLININGLIEDKRSKFFLGIFLFWVQ